MDEFSQAADRSAEMLLSFRVPFAVLFFAGLTIVPVVSPRAQWDDQQKQAQCELSAIGNTRSPLAINWIRTACNQIAINSGLLNESNTRFHTCLVQHLSGVQSDIAASRVISACRTSFPP